MILMNKIDKDIHYLIDTGKSFYDMANLPSFTPFSDKVCSFLDVLSKKLMKNEECKNYPDIITFAFFCRRSNIKKYKDSYMNKLNYRIGKGLSFHIAPSNVPINFAYSLISGLLAGNPCIVRASSKEFDQTRLICKEITNIFIVDKKFDELRNFISVIQYPRKKEINDLLSALCKIRIIWGGDSTISEIRKSELSPRGYDIVFSDRFSFSLINAEKYLSEYDSQKVALDFYNDTYLFDQNACTAPHLIYWVGEKEEVNEAQKKFWDSLYIIVSEKYHMSDVLAIDKLVTEYSASIVFPGSTLVETIDNLVKRINLFELDEEILNNRCAGGLFYEYSSNNYDEIIKILNDKFQTLSTIGFNNEQIIDFLIENRAMGIDRVVPVGKTLDFDFIWDGYDLILSMSRIIN